MDRAWRVGCNPRVNPYPWEDPTKGTSGASSAMFPFLAPLARLLEPQAGPTSRDPLQQLMERAGARAGHDPHEARELRENAAAWLRVIR